MLFSYSPALVAGGAMGYLLASYGFSAPYIIPTCLFTVVAVFRPSMYLYQRTSRRLEFKCDAYAARLGYGLELASGLVNLHRVMGLPLRWVGVDRFTVTHPPLQDRLRAIGLIPREGLEPVDG